MASHWKPGKDRVENMSRLQREATPLQFAQYLVDQVRIRTGAYTVAALWVQRRSVYRAIAGVECWDEDRDAYTYAGPHPVICHPPCGPWGKLAWRSQQDKGAGIRALIYVARFGGVVEQPNSSHLFTGGEVVEQRDFGHLAIKRTRLLWIPPNSPRPLI